MENAPEPDVHRQLAAAEFRAAAAGRIGNVETVTDLLDLGRLLDADGHVDRTKIIELVDEMAGAFTPAPSRPTIDWPAGVRQPIPRSDWLRDEFPSHVHL